MYCFNFAWFFFKPKIAIDCLKVEVAFITRDRVDLFILMINFKTIDPIN